jgi:glutamate racemase
MNDPRGDPRPIGVFDSGIGGLTVAASIRELLPAEDIVYLGDLLHLPYGSKSSSAVLEFTRAAVHFLVGEGVKLLVIACNTATSIAMRKIEGEVDVPLIGVVRPGAHAACGVTENRRIGVIGTARTVESGAYETAIREIAPDASVLQKSTPLLVPFIEEGWIGHPALAMVLDEYLHCFEGADIDTLVLGCTHYPLIREDISERLRSLYGRDDREVKIVDSARTTAESTKALLAAKGLLNRNFSTPRARAGTYRIHLTDYTDSFRDIGELIVGRSNFDPRVVSLNYDSGRVSYT